jgi:RNA polymerase sigma factor (sigma-70 family)
MLSFEDQLDIINNELLKRRTKWQLTSIADMDFDDVSQIVRVHINNKWDKWDQSQPFLNWVNTVITNQIRNIVRNNYGNVAPPCTDCKFDQGDDRCGYTSDGEKSEECPLYLKWCKTKRYAYNIRLAYSLDHEEHIENRFESSLPDENINFDKSILALTEEIKNHLSAIQFRVYNWVYVEGRSDEEVAEKMGLKTTEKNRAPGYKRIYNLKKQIQEVARKVVYAKDIVQGG